MSLYITLAVCVCTCSILHCCMVVCWRWLLSCCRLCAVTHRGKVTTASSGSCRALMHFCTAWTCTLKPSISVSRCCTTNTQRHTRISQGNNRTQSLFLTQSHTTLRDPHLSLEQLLSEAEARQLRGRQRLLNSLYRPVEALHLALQPAQILERAST